MLLLFVLILTGCGPSDAQIQAAIEQTMAAEATQVAMLITDTPATTNTPTITNTPTVTNTPEPTNTPRPTNTPTRAPEPIVLTGTSDAVVDFEKWDGPAIARISHSGSRNFAVINYGANNNRYNLLVNRIGVYEGTLPIDFFSDEHTMRFEVTASGQWEIVILPITEMRRESIPGVISGSGDDLIYLEGRNPDLLIVDGTNAKSNFVIYAYGDRRQLAVNEIAPYSGTVMINRDTIILQVIEGGGEWSIEVTTQ